MIYYIYSDPLGPVAFYRASDGSYAYLDQAGKWVDDPAVMRLIDTEPGVRAITKAEIDRIGFEDQP